MGISNRRHFIKSGAAASLGFAAACSSSRKDVAEKISASNNFLGYPLDSCTHNMYDIWVWKTILRRL